MKHRILELKDGSFIVQEKKFLFWYNLNEYYGCFFNFSSLQSAKAALKDYKNGVDMNKYAKITHNDAVKIHSI
jgi:predicted NAD-dependent protein-ADP-ribosyltransferase YbiA (DUF1768 family)